MDWSDVKDELGQIKSTKLASSVFDILYILAYKGVVKQIHQMEKGSEISLDGD